MKEKEVEEKVVKKRGKKQGTEVERKRLEKEMRWREREEKRNEREKEGWTKERKRHKKETWQNDPYWASGTSQAFTRMI